jgi:hypothetical protein
VYFSAWSGSSKAAITRRLSSALASPASTCTFQGWMLVPEGARLATARISSTVARGTGVGRKARTERRVVMAASTGLGVCDMDRWRGGWRGVRAGRPGA